MVDLEPQADPLILFLPDGIQEYRRRADKKKDRRPWPQAQEERSDRALEQQCPCRPRAKFTRLADEARGPRRGDGDKSGSGKNGLPVDQKNGDKKNRYVGGQE